VSSRAEEACEGNPNQTVDHERPQRRNGRKAASSDRHGDLSLEVDPKQEASFHEEAEPGPKVGGCQGGLQQRFRLRDALRLGECGAR